MGSIIAKVARDRMMADLDRRHPGYGFAKHKGYGTDDHREAVVRLGRSPHPPGEMFLQESCSPGGPDPKPDGLLSRPLDPGGAVAINGRRWQARRTHRLSA